MKYCHYKGHRKTGINVQQFQDRQKVPSVVWAFNDPYSVFCNCNCFFSVLLSALVDADYRCMWKDTVSEHEHCQEFTKIQQNILRILHERYELLTMQNVNLLRIIRDDLEFLAAQILPRFES